MIKLKESGGYVKMKLIKKYWSINKQAFLDWEIYKGLCVPAWMKKEYGKCLQERIESLMTRVELKNSKEVWFK